MTHAAFLTMAIGGGLIFCAGCFQYGWNIGKREFGKMACEFAEMLRE